MVNYREICIIYLLVCNAINIIIYGNTICTIQRTIFTIISLSLNLTFHIIIANQPMYACNVFGGEFFIPRSSYLIRKCARKFVKQELFSWIRKSIYLIPSRAFFSDGWFHNPCIVYGALLLITSFHYIHHLLPAVYYFANTETIGDTVSRDILIKKGWEVLYQRVYVNSIK